MNASSCESLHKRNYYYLRIKKNRVQTTPTILYLYIFLFVFFFVNISSPDALCFFVAQDRADHQNEDLSDYYLPAIYRIIHRWKNIDWITVTIHMKMDTWMVSIVEHILHLTKLCCVVNAQARTTNRFLINSNPIFVEILWFTVRSNRLNNLRYICSSIGANFTNYRTEI